MLTGNDFSKSKLGLQPIEQEAYVGCFLFCDEKDLILKEIFLDKTTYSLIENCMFFCMGNSAHDIDHIYRVSERKR